MKSIAKRAPRRRLPEAERRAQILRAAVAVARAEGLRAVTARRVAAQAGLSQGLVFFHFESTEALQGALVSSLTEQSLRSGPQPGAFGSLAAFLEARLGAVTAQSHLELIDLLVGAWVTGLDSAPTRKAVRAAAERYRAQFLPIAQAALAAEPERFAQVDAEALAGVVVGLVLGVAVQASIARPKWDVAGAQAAVRALLAPATTSKPTSRPSASS